MLPLGVASTVVAPRSHAFMACNPSTRRGSIATRGVCQVSGNTGVIRIRGKCCSMCEGLGSRNALLILSAKCASSVDLSLCHSLVRLYSCCIPGRGRTVGVARATSPRSTVSILSECFRGPVIGLSGSNYVNVRNNGIFAIPMVSRCIHISSAKTNSTFLTKFVCKLFGSCQFESYVLLKGLANNGYMANINYLARCLARRRLLGGFGRCGTRFFRWKVGGKGWCGWFGSPSSYISQQHNLQLTYGGAPYT